MPFVLLLLLGLICLQERWPEPRFFGPWENAALTLAGLAMFWLIGSRHTGWYCRQAVKNSADRRALAQDFHTRQRRYFFALAAFYLIALYLLGWGWTVKEAWGPDAWPMASGVKLILVLPFLIGLTAAWARSYDLEKTLYDLDRPVPEEGFLGRWAYVLLQVRFNLLLVVLFLFLMLLHDTVYGLFPELQGDESFLPLFTLAFLAIAFPSIPWLLHCSWAFVRCRRGRCVRTCRPSLSFGFRCSDVLIWNTRNSMANALVTGILPWARYIVLTDRLVRKLSTEEIQSVLGHEIGHVKHHHMSFYMMFLLGSLLTLGCLWQMCENLIVSSTAPGLFLQEHVPLLNDWRPSWEVFAAIPPLFLGGIYVYFVFGYLSRFCERQADIFGCRATSCQVFVNALEKVAFLNGIHRDKPGWLSCWLHPTIASRVDFLQRMQESPQLESRFQRRVAMVKWCVSLTLGAVLAVTLWFGVKPSSTAEAKTMAPEIAVPH